MKTSTIKMLLALAPAFAIAGCASEDSSEELGPEGCVGGKCDDVTDPAEFACQGVSDLTGVRAGGFIADLDDRRVLVQPSRADAIRAEIERYQQSTQYVAPTTMTKQ